MVLILITILFPDAFNDPDSHEMMISKVLGADKVPSKRKAGADKDHVVQMVQEQVSRRLHKEHQASRDQSDPNSEEAMIVDTQEAEPSSGKQVIHSSGEQTINSASQGMALQRKATPARVNGVVNGFNGVLAPGRSRELQDLDSLEDNNGRHEPVGNRGDTDYDGKTLHDILFQHRCSKQIKAKLLTLLFPQKLEKL